MAKSSTQDLTPEQEASLARVEAGADLMERKSFNAVRLDEAPETYEQALAAMEGLGFTVTTATPDTIGDSFSEVDKEQLLNTPLVILTWEQDAGTQRMSSAGFLIVKGITKTGLKFRFSCGGYGLAEELTKLTKQRQAAGTPGVNAGLILPKGLARSQVEGDTDDGEHYKSWIYRCNL